MSSAPVAFPVEAAKASTLEDEILNAYAARVKLREAIEDQEKKRDDAVFDLAKKLANDLHGTAPDVEDAFKRDEAWKASNDRYQQRITALSDLQEKNELLIEKYKADVPDVVRSALNRRLQEFNKTVTDTAEAAAEARKEKASLEKELASLPAPKNDYGAESKSDDTSAKASKK
ncbi:MAG TPA: hypothetical protein VIG25_04820 [Pyrinomonadaceae bacterium]|jgi:molybdopterin converting factor small subunit